MWFFEMLHESTPVWLNYGVEHLCFIILVVTLTFASILRIRTLSNKGFRIFLFVCYCILIFWEIIKQLYFGTGIENGIVTWGPYQWYILPYVFCSTPYYILPFIIFCKEGKLRDCCMGFYTSFCLFAGFIVFFFFQDTCYIDNVWINVQTTIHHGVMFLTAVSVGVYYKEKLSFKFFLNGLKVFACLLAIAVLFNEVGYHLLGADSINCFHITYHVDCPLAVIGSMWKAESGIFNYILFLLFYFVAFSFVGLLIFSLLYYPVKRDFLFIKRKEKKYE